MRLPNETPEDQWNGNALSYRTIAKVAVFEAVELRSSLGR